MAKIPGMGMESDEKLEARAEKYLHAGLDLVETVLLSGPGKFLENGDKVSLADIVLLCQLKQLKVLPKYDVLIIITVFVFECSKALRQLHVPNRNVEEHQIGMIS